MSSNVWMAGSCLLVAASSAGATESTSDAAYDTKAALIAAAGASALTAAEGETTLKMGGYFQFRYTTSLGDDINGVAGQDNEQGFSLQRTRLIFMGSVHGFDFLLLPYAGPDGNFSILDAWAKTEIGETGWEVQFGQFKLPFWREWLVSERFIQPVERSEVSGVFSSVYAQGVQLSTGTEDARFSVAFSDGLRTINTSYTNDAEADYAITARGELKFGGAWKQFGDITSLGNEEGGFLVGAALHHQGPTMSFRGTDIDRLTQYTVDLSYEGVGWNLFGAFVGRNTSVSAGGGTADDFGLLAEGGVFATDRLEFFGRGSMLIPDGDATGDETFTTLTAGLNYYLYNHAAKFTFDAVWSLDDPNETTMIGFGPSAATGRLSTSGDDQVALRAQFQIIF